MLRIFVAILIACSCAGLAWAADRDPSTPSGAVERFSINDAINQAAQTNPGVGEASANRRATEAEMRQSQGVLLPQVRLQADAGPERLSRFITPAPIDNGTWR